MEKDNTAEKVKFNLSESLHARIDDFEELASFQRNILLQILTIIYIIEVNSKLDCSINGYIDRKCNKNMLLKKRILT